MIKRGLFTLLTQVKIDKCRFDHPRSGGGQPVSNNRYAVLNSDSPGHGGGRG